MLKVEHLFAGYDSKIVLKNISLQLYRGTVTALLGPNGSGKSTLLKAIDGIIKPDNGAIILDTMNINAMTKNNIAQSIAYLPQSGNSFPSCNVFESILLGRKPYISFEPTKHDMEIVEKTINNFNIDSLAFRTINQLSGGEIQKVLIARAIVQEPEVLLLDEPINHLDIKNQIEILQIIRYYTINYNLITLIVFHDINRALQFADKFIVLKEGYVYGDGDSKIVNPEIMKGVYGIDLDCIEYKGRKLLFV